jgi:hypothetical protein
MTRTIDIVALVVDHAMPTEMALADYLVDRRFVCLERGIRTNVL